MGAGTPGMTGTSGIPVAPVAPLGRRGRLALLAAAAILVVALAVVAVWAVLDPARYSSSGEGCVTLTVPNSTGGAVIHACGDHARTLCRAAFTSEDRIAVLTRTQCQIAGLGPLRPSSAATP
jgi:hypothetical protein